MNRIFGKFQIRFVDRNMVERVLFTITVSRQIRSAETGFAWKLQCLFYLKNMNLTCSIWGFCAEIWQLLLRKCQLFQICILSIRDVLFAFLEAKDKHKHFQIFVFSASKNPKKNVFNEEIQKWKFLPWMTVTLSYLGTKASNRKMNGWFRFGGYDWDSFS